MQQGGRNFRNPHARALRGAYGGNYYPVSKAHYLVLVIRKHINKSECKISCNCNMVLLKPIQLQSMVKSPRTCSCWLLWLRHQLWENPLIIMPFKTLMPGCHSKGFLAFLLSYTVKCHHNCARTQWKLTRKIIKQYGQKH
jgi:hypothetical protein